MVLKIVPDSENNQWNNLPPEVLGAPSLGVWKKKSAICLSDLLLEQRIGL